jgi:hypothetical protein
VLSFLDKRNLLNLKIEKLMNYILIPIMILSVSACNYGKGNTLKFANHDYKKNPANYSSFHAYSKEQDKGLTEDEQIVLKVCSSDKDIVNALDIIITNIKTDCEKLNNSSNKEKHIKQNPVKWVLKDRRVN